MTLVPLSSVPVEVRHEYALELVGMGLLDGVDALAVAIFPGDALVPKDAIPEPRTSRPHWKSVCEDCGGACWTRGGVPRCRSCSNRARSAETTKGFCTNGHPWTAENVYTRPNGYEYCRECARASKSAFRKRNRQRYYRVPCSVCGEPSCPPEHKNKGGAPFARCRKCYMQARREKRRAAA